MPIRLAEGGHRLRHTDREGWRGGREGGRERQRHRQRETQTQTHTETGEGAIPNNNHKKFRREEEKNTPYLLKKFGVHPIYGTTNSVVMVFVVVVFVCLFVLFLATVVHQPHPFCCWSFTFRQSTA